MSTVKANRAKTGRQAARDAGGNSQRPRTQSAKLPRQSRNNNKANDQNMSMVRTDVAEIVDRSIYDNVVAHPITGGVANATAGYPATSADCEIECESCGATPPGRRRHTPTTQGRQQGNDSALENAEQSQRPRTQKASANDPRRRRLNPTAGTTRTQEAFANDPRRPGKPPSR